MALDLIRTCYTSYMRFWDGTQERLVKGRWFRVSDVALDFPGPHSYASLKTYDREYVNDGVGEDLRLGTKYDKGANHLGYRGDHYCGSGRAFLTGGTWGVDPPIVTDAVGYAACCSGPPPGSGPLGIGGEAEFFSVNLDLSAAHLAIGGTGYADLLAIMRTASSFVVVVNAGGTLTPQLGVASAFVGEVVEPSLLERLASGSALLGEVTLAPSLAESLQGGSSLLGVVTLAPSLVESLTGGSALVGQVTLAPSLVESLHGGSALVGQVTLAPSLVESLHGGSALVGQVTLAPSLVESLHGGSALLGQVTLAPSLAEGLHGGSALSASVVMETGGVTPGASCAAAPTLAVSTPYTFTMPATFGTEQWVKWSPAAGTYHLDFSSVGEGESFNNMATATSCAAIGDFLVLGTGCTTIVLSSGQSVFIQVVNFDGFSFSWSAELSPGAC